MMNYLLHIFLSLAPFCCGEAQPRENGSGDCRKQTFRYQLCPGPPNELQPPSFLLSITAQQQKAVIKMNSPSFTPPGGNSQVADPQTMAAVKSVRVSLLPPSRPSLAGHIGGRDAVREARAVQEANISRRRCKL